MSSTFLFRSGLMALALAFSLSSCDFWECEAGRDGCGNPGLRVCQGPFLPGRSYTALATYFDDTGAHPATINSASTSSPGVVSLADGGSTGLLTITALGTGAGRITLELSGWKGESFTWAFEVTADGGVPADAGAFPFRIARGLPDGGDCVAQELLLAP